MKYVKISDNTNLCRDSFSGAIINTNMNEYNNYIQQKKLKQQESERIKNIENDLNNIKDDLSEIKNLLRGLSDEPR